MRYRPRPSKPSHRIAPELLPQIDILFDNLPAGIVIHGSDGRILSANRRACELLGRDHNLLVGCEPTDAVWHFVHEDETLMPPSEYPVNQVLHNGMPRSDLVVGIPGLPDGRIRWLICNAYMETDEDGLVDRVIVCFTDCTALKYAEQSKHKSEERLRLVLQGSTDAPWDWDLLTGEIYYSERWWDMLGYRPGELSPVAGLWARLVHPDDREALSAFNAALSTQPRQTYAIEFRLRHRDGHYVPILSRGFVLRNEQGEAVRVSGTNSDLSERKANERRIYELAYFDYLTGLPNRRLLAEELEQALARSSAAGQFGALLFIDLDNFKLLNDTLGHAAGDQLLRQAADRLRAGLGGAARLSRFGGDEFVVVLENLGDSAARARKQADRAGKTVLDLLDAPYRLAERTCTSTPSIGITLFGHGGDRVETLLKQADLAMYRAKAEGRNTWRFFDPDMQVEVDGRAMLQDSLRAGLSQREFVLYCQPQFGRDGALCGAEVLVRWQHGERGLVGPGEFIGLAEASGLIVPLGRHVLEESCRALARWAADPVLGRLELAVNVSVYQLRDPGFPSSVADALAAAGAPACKLWLELTESVFAEDTVALIERMHQLRALGVQLALDDFGTGYSSLAYLRQFPLAALKIDRSFVNDLVDAPNGAPIVDAIVALARKLELQIIAEGVEHAAQRDYLIACGCDALQGYLLGMPMPIGEFERRYGAHAAPENNRPPSL